MDPAQTILEELKTLADADPRDLTPQQIEVIRGALLDDLFAFAQEVFEYRDLVPHLHGRIAGLLELWGTPGYERLMIQCPRESYKSSLCTRANALWQVCREPDKPVAIFNEREPNVSKWIRASREVVQSNTLFQVLFRDLLPPGIARGDSRSMPRWWKWSAIQITPRTSRPPSGCWSGSCPPAVGVTMTKAASTSTPKRPSDWPTQPFA